MDEFVIQYGKTSGTGYEEIVIQSPDSSGIGAEIQESITGLERNTEYFFRILARNANGDSVPAGDFILTTAVPIPAENGFGVVGAALLLSIVGLVSIS